MYMCMCSVWTELYVQVMCITWISRTLDAPVQFSVTKMCTTAARGKSYIFVFSWLQMFHNECAWLTTCDSINDEIDVKHSHTQTHTRAYSLARVHNEILKTQVLATNVSMKAYTDDLYCFWTHRSKVDCVYMTSTKQI